MYCTNCGAQNPDGSSFCSNCGNRLNPPQTTAQPAPATTTPVAPTATATPARKTNGLAIAALILGIVGFLPPPFTICTIPAIIMGAIALNQIKKEPRVEGKGMALAGIICGSISLFLWIIAIILIIVFAVTSTTTNSSNFSVTALTLVSLI